MFFPVHDKAVVDFIREDNKLMFSRNIHDFLENFPGIERSGRIVGIDKDDRLCSVCDLLLNVVDIRIPLGLFVADVVNGGTACQGGAGSPQRIVRGGDQDLVACIQKSGHAEIDQLTDAISGINIVNGDVGDIFQLGVLHDRLPGGKKSLCRGISLAVGKLLAHVVNHLVRSAESERSRIADVQFQHIGPFFFHSVGLLYNRPSYII